MGLHSTYESGSLHKGEDYSPRFANDAPCNWNKRGGEYNKPSDDDERHHEGEPEPWK